MSSKAPIDYDLICKLSELLSKSDLNEIEIEHESLHLRLTRHSMPVQAVHAAPVLAAPTPVLAATAAPMVEAALSAATASANIIKSPMVGTAYMSPEPGAAAFVRIGDMVKTGQTVLIIEAMKTMNQIPAHKDGKIAAILVEDAQPVEFGEPLIVIE